MARARTIWTLAAQFPHRLNKLRNCPKCGELSSGHEFKIGRFWVCRRCADKKAAA